MTKCLITILNVYQYFLNNLNASLVCCHFLLLLLLLLLSCNLLKESECIVNLLIKDVLILAQNKQFRDRSAVQYRSSDLSCVPILTGIC